MEKRTIKFTMRVLAPVHHGAFGEETGNLVALRRVPLVNVPGMPRVPCYSGNALRGITRRLVMRDLFQRAGLGPGSLPGKQWDKLYAALANGGTLEGTGEANVKPEEVRQLRETLPPLSVFGAALYTWMLSGHVMFGFLWPRCRETLAAGLVTTAPDVAAEDLVAEISFCRHIDREMQDPEASGVTPMPVTVEAFCPGTILESKISFTPSATDVEMSCVVYGLTLVREVGGLIARGFGNVDVCFWDNVGTEAYMQWLEQTTDLRDRLVALAERLAH